METLREKTKLFVQTLLTSQDQETAVNDAISELDVPGDELKECASELQFIPGPAAYVAGFVMGQRIAKGK